MKFEYKTKLAINLPKVKFDDGDSKALRKKANSAAGTANIKAMTAVERALKPALDAAINSLWAWNRNPIWKDGTQPGNPRDIVHTGKLRDSLSMKTRFLKTKSDISISYKTPYAAFVYYGGAMQPYGNPNAATVLIPGRPWIEAIMNGTHGQEKFDFIKIFNDTWNAEFQKRIA